MTSDNQTQEIGANFDVKMMKRALDLARKSESIGEVPIGAVITDKNGKIIAQSTNLRETKCTVLGHAELAAVHRACKALGSWRLTDCTMYVTLEPCFMCAGALVQSRIGRVVFGTRDPKGGALVTMASLGKDPRLNHQFEITEGILSEDCGNILKDFFKKKRSKIP